MDVFYYLSQPPTQKSWVDVVGIFAPVVATIAAIVISLRVARRQNDIQERQFTKEAEMQGRQLKKDLFDRRFNVYTDTGDFLNYVRRNDGKIELSGPEYLRFHEAIEKAEMLFRQEVHKYLIEIRDTAGDFYADKFKENEAAITGNQEVINRLDELRKRLSALWKQRNDVFRPDLHLESWIPLANLHGRPRIASLQL